LPPLLGKGRWETSGDETRLEGLSLFSALFAGGGQLRHELRASSESRSFED